MKRYVIAVIAISLLTISCVNIYLLKQPPKSVQSLPPKSLFGQIIDKVYEPENIVLVAAGDVMLGRSINYKSVTSNNFTWYFDKTAEVFRSADIALINLESPLVENCPLTNEGMKFCADIRNIEGLKFAGIDIAGLANNHMFNYGADGIATTKQLLENAGINAIGLSQPVYKKIKGTRFAFLAYNDTGAGGPEIATPFTPGELRLTPGVFAAFQEIAAAKNQADIVIVSFHWGQEYAAQPSKRQKELAYLAIDSGADVVIGHHPHWVQPIEMYKEKLIAYSLGNFIFDQFWSEKTREGLALRFTFLGKKLINHESLPIKINNSGQPSFVTLF